VTSYIYRLFVMVAISLFVATKYFFIGTLLAVWSVWSSLFLPIIKMVFKPMSDTLMRGKRTRIIGLSSLLLLGVFAFLFLVPLPYKTYAQGVLYVPQDAFIRAAVSGFINDVVVPEEQSVTAGEKLITMRAPDLDAEVRVLVAQVNEAAMRYQASLSDRSGSDILLNELNFIKDEYQRAHERLSDLAVYSPVDGVLMMKNRLDIRGRYYFRGEVIGYVVDDKNLPLAVMISEDDIDRVTNQTRSVSFRYASEPNIQYEAHISHQVPASTQQLPSATLTTEAGGAIVLDPERKTELKSYKRYFRIELSRQERLKRRFDERVYVLFEHDPEPIVWRWYRNVRRLFLRQFDV
jgi:putative peptide zinc metalloprotease protein